MGPCKVASKRIDLIPYFGYQSKVMERRLEEIISAREIRNNQFPFGVLNSIADLFGKAVKCSDEWKYGTIVDDIKYNPLDGNAAYILCIDMIKYAENLQWKTNEDTKILESKVKEFYDFIKTLNKPRELNDLSLNIAKRLSLFFKKLNELVVYHSNDRVSGNYSKYVYSS